MRRSAVELSPQEAASALRDIETAERRSETLRGYAQGSPHLVLWGILWVVGYGLTDFFPRHGQTIWAVIVAIGLSAGFAAIRRGGHDVGWRYGAVALTLAGFFCAVFAVLAPVNGRQVAAVIPLAVAAAYVLVGISRGPRFAVSGLAIAALTLAGFFLLRQHFFLWMAGVGGAALILAGVWLRRV
jgi:hypothetical protein